MSGQSQCLQFLIVRQASNLSTHRPANIHNRCLWQLLYTFTHHTSGKPSKLSKGQIVRFVFEPDVQIEGRNIHRAGFYHLRTLHVLGHTVHRAVYLLIDLNKQEVNVAARLEGHHHVACIHSRLTTDTLHTSHLHQLATKWRNNIMVNLTGRITWHISLHRNLRHINIRHQ